MAVLTRRQFLAAGGALAASAWLQRRTDWGAAAESTRTGTWSCQRTDSISSEDYNYELGQR